MMKKARTKTAAPALPVPQSLTEAQAQVARIGALQRSIAGIQRRLDDRVAKLKTEAEADAAGPKAEVEALTEGLRTWAEANRQALTDGGRTKTADLGTGKVMWRLRPPKVTLRGGAEAVIESLRMLGLGRFVRTEESVDKEAMLRDPDFARTVPGVSIGSAGEEFVVEPLSIALSETTEAVS